MLQNGGVFPRTQYLRAGLEDSLQFALSSPIVLGRGEALFADLDLSVLGFSVTEHTATEHATISYWKELKGVAHISRFSKCGNRPRSPLSKQRGKICSSSEIHLSTSRKMGHPSLELTLRFESHRLDEEVATRPEPHASAF